MALSLWTLALIPVLLYIGAVQGQGSSPELVLLLTERHSYFTPGLIYQVQLHHKNYSQVPVTGMVTPAAIDYDEVHNRVYWTDITTEEVRRADLNGNNSVVVANLNSSSYPEGLTVDGGVGQVFYTDRGDQVIVKLDVGTLEATTIVNDSMDAPWGIVADTLNKKVYWVDHGHDTGGDRIESCDYEGNMRRNVTTTDIYAAVGIALNAKAGRLFWCEYNGEVKTILTDGTDQRELVERTNPIKRFMDIAYFNGMLYLSDNTNSRIYIIPENGGSPAVLNSRYFGNLNGIHVYSPSGQTGCPDGFYGVGCAQACGRCKEGIVCEKTVGVCFGGCDVGYTGTNCHDVCEAGTYGYRCTSTCGHCSTGTTCNHVTGTCPSGCQEGWEGTSCKDQTGLPQLVVLMTERHESSARLGRIYKLFLHHMNYTLLTTNNVITPVSIDYDTVNKRMYWTDISTEQVRSADLHGDGDTVVADLNSFSYPEGIAVDGAAGKVFYTDRGNNVIVSIDLADNTNTTIAENLTMPWGIVADKTNKRLYWVDHTNNTIQSCDYTGQQRRTVISTNIVYATGIAINEKLNRLYWCEYDGEVKSVGTDGTGYRLLLNTTSPSRLFMDISLFNGFLYMTDRRYSNITIIPESGGKMMRLSSSSFGDLAGIHVFSPNTAETGCEDGKYGVGCTSVCGHCENDTPCEKTIGVCLAGCVVGYQGELCDDECTPGTYGDDCGQSCGQCADGTTCDHETGRCPAGCQQGWKGSDCTIEACKPGNYGNHTCVPCGQCKNRDACNVDTGKCPNGCGPGWIGDNCQTPCPSFKYGDQCSQTCGHCALSISCDRQTGKCYAGCSEGYLGDNCQTKRVCASHQYGLSCLQCGWCKGGVACDVDSGNCPNGCDDTHMGYRCQTPKQMCSAGLFGSSCQSVCGRCKDGDTCLYTDGSCPNGCSPGWYGSICKLACPHNKYGEECKRDCGFCKDADTCDHESGTCPLGCERGFEGDFCQTKIAPTASKSTSKASAVMMDIYGLLGLLVLSMTTYSSML